MASSGGGGGSPGVQWREVQIIERVVKAADKVVLVEVVRRRVEIMALLV